jgi:hypothetical protein
MQRFFSSLARLYQRVVHLAARASTPDLSQPSAQEPSVAARRAAAKRARSQPVQPSQPAQAETPIPARPQPRPVPAAPPPSVASNPNLARLIRDLRSTDGMKRPDVAKRIKAFGPAAAPALIPLVSDSEWVMRYWAAYLLKDMADPTALPALQHQLPLETQHAVKEQITAAIQTLRLFKSPGAASTAKELAALPVAMQGRLDELRRDLIQAYRGHDMTRAERIRQHLVNMQVQLCERLRRQSLSPQERQRLTNYYLNASVRGRLLKRKANDYHNNCWVCRADVDSSVNRQCGCKWLICECGACQCPDFSIGQRGHQPECQQQIARFGLARYQELIEERRKLYGGWSRARVDFAR